MERDFLGLNSKEMVVKEETVEGCKDSVFSKVPGVPWPLSNKASVLPHFMPFKVAEEGKTANFLPDPLASSGLITIATADAFDPIQKREIQKNINHNRQGGAHFPMIAFPTPQNVNSMQIPHDVKITPFSNQTISVSMSNPFFKSYFSGSGQNFVGANMKQQLLGGIPVSASHSIPPICSAAGSTEPLFNCKAAGAPPQLTIFYGGTVNVYNDISPEKAQAIMFLAGNGSPAAPKIAQPRAQVQAPTSKLAAGDVGLVNQPMNMPPYSGLSSPMSVSSHPVGQSGSGSSKNDEVMTVKSSGISTTPVSTVDSPRTVTSLGPVAGNNMMPSAIPQARKASLARFLEKRKERVMNSAPYNLS